MLEILLIVSPTFLMIGAGYGAVRLGVFPQSGVDALVAFAVRIAVPVLLFLKMYSLDLASAFSLGLLAAFFLGAFASFGIGVALARALKRRPGEAIAVGFSAMFSNTVLIGLPVMERAYGPEALTPMYGIIAFHAPVMYTVGFLAMETTRRDGAGPWAALKRTARSLSTNALTIGIALGLALRAAGATLPEPVYATLQQFEAAALPVGLFSLGAAMTRYRLSSEIGLGAAIAALGLVAHPAATFALGWGVFDLPSELLAISVVTAAMPAGVNIYVFAALFKRAEGLAATVVLLSTACAVVTVSAWLAVL